MINPSNRDFPHIAAMGRDEILQQTHLKALKLNRFKLKAIKALIYAIILRSIDFKGRVWHYHFI
ncbi:hypothetical protein [Helicobacter pylori]|uniref:hypothetical protein n=1 Tax=Helicobacter pylori TaxID=210 RepID=UPI00041E2187